jgi:hypothetical protein
MKSIFGKSPISSIAGYLLAAILVAQQFVTTGEKHWYVIALAAALAAIGRFASDRIALGDNPNTSIAGLLQLIVVTATQAFGEGPVNWSTLGISLAIAILGRIAGDSSNTSNKAKY